MQNGNGHRLKDRLKKEYPCRALKCQEVFDVFQKRNGHEIEMHGGKTLNATRRKRVSREIPIMVNYCYNCGVKQPTGSVNR